MSDFRSDNEVLKTETPYLPNNFIKALLDNPNIFEACPDDNFPSSYSFDAIIS